MPGSGGRCRPARSSPRAAPCCGWLGPASYGWALAGQFVIAAGQPLVLNSITKIAARYFPPEERTAAISVGSVALFAGVLAAVLSGGPLFDAGGLRLLVWTQAARPSSPRSGSSRRPDAGGVHG